ncbi:hypothetical protein HPSA50_0780 [Helicobacter pylori SouthAfrica50]|uniref:Uncharacterized protein n=1 Tax=Helicobacter pylori SouthAfrica50 TaxID=1352357 RepID=T2S756_HELPX|nr:hypothetical protein HPSA50_0780 [Helicobacter pylori SouthAfrica50]
MLTPEAKKLLETEALDCLRHAKTEAQKKNASKISLKRCNKKCWIKKFAIHIKRLCSHQILIAKTFMVG